VSNSLFRKDALEAAATRSQGAPFVDYPLALSKVAFVSMAVLLTAVVAACFVEVQDRRYVSGLTQPQAGVIHVFPEHPGVISSELKAVGSLVDKGEPILLMSSQPRSQPGGLASVKADSASRARLESLKQSAADGDMRKARIEGITMQMRQAESAIAGISRNITIASEVSRVKAEKLERAKRLAGTDYVSRDFLSERQEELLEAQYRLQELEKERSRLKLELSTGQARLREENAAQRENARGLDREILDEVERQSKRNDAMEFQVRSPAKGYISALNYTRGQYVNGVREVLTILPEGAEMWCVLEVPARELAFIQSGQKVSIRYTSYPYQYFGSFPGVVKRIDGVPVNADEDGAAKMDARYRVYVEPIQKTIPTSAGPRPIVPGMGVEAVVWLDKRSLISWLLRPMMEKLADRVGHEA
jgi:membrane fusion protein